MIQRQRGQRERLDTCNDHRHGLDVVTQISVFNSSSKSSTTGGQEVTSPTAALYWQEVQYRYF